MKIVLFFTMQDGKWNDYPTPPACIRAGMPFLKKQIDVTSNSIDTDIAGICIATEDSFLDFSFSEQPMWCIPCNPTGKLSSIIGK